MRGLAKLLVDPDASKDAIDNKRAQVSKWRKGGKRHGISDQNAWAIADALNSIGGNYPVDHFTKERTMTAEEQNRQEIAALKRELAQLRTPPSSPPVSETERKTA